MSWREAWARAEPLLAGVTRGRVPGAEPNVELAILDWGGSGDLVLMHHANGFCGATMAPVAHALRDRYRVVTVDARGHGDSTAVAPGGDPDPYDWMTLTRDLDRAVEAVLERTGHARVELGIGHSLGGAMMLSAAALAPSRFARILACDPVILPKMTPEQQAAHSRGSGLAAATLKRRDRFPSQEEAFEHCRSRRLFSGFTPEALALYVGEGMRETVDGEIALKCDREVEAAIFGGGGALGLSETIQAVVAEVLILHALRGNFSRAVYDEVAGAMPNARVEGVDVGHLFPMEQPGVVLSAVEALMQSRIV